MLCQGIEDTIRHITNLLNLNLTHWTLIKALIYYKKETGQYYLRARYYNPTVGRFTQEDTYRGDGLNLYAYCENNPVLYYDPSGHNLAAKPSNGPETTNTSGVEKGNLGDSFTDAGDTKLKGRTGDINNLSEEYPLYRQKANSGKFSKLKSL